MEGLGLRESSSSIERIGRRFAYMMLFASTTQCADKDEKKAPDRGPSMFAQLFLLVILIEALSHVQV